MFRPPSTQSSSPRKIAGDGLEFIEHDWPIGMLLVSLWSFGLFFAIFVEKFEYPSAGGLWMIFAAPFALRGIWISALRREYRFFPAARVVEVSGFHLFRGRFAATHGYDVVRSSVEQRWVLGPGGGTLWFVMVRGPDFEIALDTLRTKEEAVDRLKGYSLGVENA